MKFDTDKFKKSAEGSIIRILDTEIKNNLGVIYIYFKNLNLDYIRIPLEYVGSNNCINIYHGESTKNGYWWDGELDYDRLVNVLEDYA